MLGLQPGASASAIKAAWRRLAREHHPDVVGNDPAAARAATKRMAEINAAYEQLRDAHRRPGGIGSGADATGGSPTLGPAATQADPTGDRPTRHERRPPPAQRDDDTGRAGHPVGPAADPVASRRHRAAPGIRPERAARPLAGPRLPPPRWPSLAVRAATEMPFGKFHGHTLGEIAAFEPSYVDWMASTIVRDPDLLAAARVLRDDLDRRGIVRRTRPSRVPPAPPTD